MTAICLSVYLCITMPQSSTLTRRSQSRAALETRTLVVGASVPCNFDNHVNPTITLHHVQAEARRGENKSRSASVGGTYRHLSRGSYPGSPIKSRLVAEGFGSRTRSARRLAIFIRDQALKVRGANLHPVRCPCRLHPLFLSSLYPERAL